MKDFKVYFREEMLKYPKEGASNAKKLLKYAGLPSNQKKYKAKLNVLSHTNNSKLTFVELNYLLECTKKNIEYQPNSEYVERILELWKRILTRNQGKSSITQLHLPAETIYIPRLGHVNKMDLLDEDVLLKMFDETKLELTTNELIQNLAYIFEKGDLIKPLLKKDNLIFSSSDITLIAKLNLPLLAKKAGYYNIEDKKLYLNSIKLSPTHFIDYSIKYKTKKIPFSEIIEDAQNPFFTPSIEVKNGRKYIYLDTLLHKITLNLETLTINVSDKPLPEELVKYTDCTLSDFNKKLRVLKSHFASYFLSPSNLLTEPQICLIQGRKFTIPKLDFSLELPKFTNQIQEELEKLYSQIDDSLLNGFNSLEHSLLARDLLKLIEKYNRQISQTSIIKIARGLSNEYTGNQNEFNCYNLLPNEFIERMLRKLHHKNLVETRSKKGTWITYEAYYVNMKTIPPVPIQKQKIISLIEEVKNTQDKTLADYGKILAMLKPKDVDVFCKKMGDLEKIFKNAPKEIKKALTILKSAETDLATIKIIRKLSKVN